MDIIESLRQVGLTQYEAEAYHALLQEGPLTGYQLGKRSRVPLPRSYDVLERLSERGLALVQPGDPPRYLAEDPARFLEQLRSSMTSRLEKLAATVMAVPASDVREEFWVIRGRERIRDRAAAMIGEAEHSLGLHVPASMRGDMGGLVSEARGRGRRVLQAARTARLAADAVLVLVDDREVLAGTAATDRSQAVVTGNRALLAMAQACFQAELPRQRPTRPTETVRGTNDWLAWEEDKQKRLRLLIGGSDVA
jgi:HTH-type transcriptional regulator, sugar sensing transcriptional regulator